MPICNSKFVMTSALDSMALLRGSATSAMQKYMHTPYPLSHFTSSYLYAVDIWRYNHPYLYPLSYVNCHWDNHLNFRGIGYGLHRSRVQAWALLEQALDRPRAVLGPSLGWATGPCKRAIHTPPHRQSK